MLRPMPILRLISRLLNALLKLKTPGKYPGLLLLGEAEEIHSFKIYACVVGDIQNQLVGIPYQLVFVLGEVKNEFN